MDVVKNRKMIHFKVTWQKQKGPVASPEVKMDALMGLFKNDKGIWVRQIDLWSAHLIVEEGAEVDNMGKMNDLGLFTAEDDRATRLPGDQRPWGRQSMVPFEGGMDEDDRKSQSSVVSRTAMHKVEEKEQDLSINAAVVKMQIPQIDTISVRIPAKERMIQVAKEMFGKLGQDVKITEMGKGQREKTLKVQGLAPVAACILAETVIPAGGDAMMITVQQTAQARLAKANLQKHANMEHWRKSLWEDVAKGKLKNKWARVEKPRQQQAAAPAAAKKEISIPNKLQLRLDKFWWTNEKTDDDATLKAMIKKEVGFKFQEKAASGGAGASGRNR
eukprot:gene35967-30372_t